MRFNYFAATDTGRRYNHNEDYYLVPPENCSLKAKCLPLFILCDGMGGAKSGEVASKLSAQWLHKSISEKMLHLNPDTLFNKDELVSIQQDISVLMQDTHSKIKALAQEHQEYEGMGSTIVTTLFTGNNLIIHSVGDSRCYRFRNQELKQLTEDQSEVWKLFEMGAITKDKLSDHPRKNIITMAMGVSDPLQINTYVEDCRNNDLFLLCSDGLTDMLYDNSIQEVLQQDLTLQEKGKQLISMANNAGGKDNITVILIAVQSS